MHNSGQTVKYETFSTAEVAARAGVHRDTLLRWLRQRVIPEPKRNRHGWRIFSEKDVREIVAYSENGHPRDAAGVGEPETPYAGKLQGLTALDWTFADAKTDYLTHGIHPYPAKFIPQIPNALIQELSSVGDTVLDMFCGSGTTLVEALVLKRHAVGIDANPLACLISKAKTTVITNEDRLVLEELIQKAKEFAASISIAIPNLFNDAPFSSSASRPDHKATEFWFEPFVVEELAEIRSWCASLPTTTAQTLSFTAFSAIIVAVSKQDSDTRYVRRSKSLSPGIAFARFAKSLTAIVQATVEFADLYEDRFTCRILDTNVLAPSFHDPVGLVVSSPPYPNAYSYHLYHMTRMLWLEMDQPTFKSNEIGSHRKYSSKSKTAATVDTFRDEFGSIFQWIRDVLRPNKYCCLVIGDSTIRGERIDNADLLSEVAQPFGLVEVARIPRRLNDVKKSFNPKIGKIKTEKILVLQNAV